MEQILLDLKKRADKILPDIIRWRRTLHQTPELRMETVKTEAMILSFLQEIGVTDIRAGVGGHGICAVIHGTRPGKCLAIRADCDGLPIREETNLPFASQNGNMHACGHDAHTAMALGAAKLLMENRHLIKGCVKFIFQPFEEGDGGAKLMIADNALENPHVDAIIGLHNHCTPDDSYKRGDILVTSEPISANIYAYRAVFKGTGSHICHVRTAKNPVYMACDAVSKIAKLDDGISETVNGVSVVNGGVRGNIIPETCSIAGSIRAFDTDLHEKMKSQVFDIIHESAAAHGGSAEIHTTVDLMATQINKPLFDRFSETVNSLYPERGCIPLKKRDMIGEDFARFSALIPGVFFFLHTKPENTCYPLHHSKFDVDESVLGKGSAVFAAFALKWQNDGFTKIN